MTVSRLLKNGGFMALGSVIGGTGVVALEVFLIGKIGKNGVLRAMMVETVKDMIKYAMFGEDRRYSRPRYAVNYSKYTERYNTPWSGWNDIENVRLNMRYEAFQVIDEIERVCDEYGYVSITDVKDLMSISTKGCYTEHAYGWYKTDEIKVKKFKDGYGLRFPQPVRID